MKQNRALRMTRVLPLAALAFGLGLGALSSPAWAGSNTASLAVSATVLTTCTIATTPVAFVPYDPAVANASTPLDGTGTVIVTCTQGAGVSVGLDTGVNAGGASGTTRAMKDGTTHFLSYELYQNSGHTTLWGTGANVQNIGAAPSVVPRTYTVYGRIPAGQDTPVGVYTDTVVATVNF